jgi:hypothetical protein
VSRYLWASVSDLNPTLAESIGAAGAVGAAGMLIGAAGAGAVVADGDARGKSLGATGAAGMLIGAAGAGAVVADGDARGKSIGAAEAAGMLIGAAGAGAAEAVGAVAVADGDARVGVLLSFLFLEAERGGVQALDVAPTGRLPLPLNQRCHMVVVIRGSVITSLKRLRLTICGYGGY